MYLHCKLERNLKKYKKLNKKEYIVAIEKALFLYKNSSAQYLEKIFPNNLEKYKKYILLYKTEFGTQLNRFLLPNFLKVYIPATIKETIENIDEFLNKNLLSHDIILYRGEKLSFSVFNNILNTKEHKNLTYCSTSHSKTISIGFSNSYKEIPGIKVLWKIHCKKGQKVAFIDNINSENPELEFLIARDSIFKITKINKINENYYELDCDLIQ